MDFLFLITSCTLLKNPDYFYMWHRMAHNDHKTQSQPQLPGVPTSANISEAVTSRPYGLPPMGLSIYIFHASFLATPYSWWTPKYWLTPCWGGLPNFVCTPSGSWPKVYVCLHILWSWPVFVWQPTLGSSKNSVFLMFFRIFTWPTHWTLNMAYIHRWFNKGLYDCIGKHNKRENTKS